MSKKKQTLTVVRSRYVPTQTYEEFVEARKAGFGGSDIGDMLNSEPYGCHRRLVLDKIGILPPRDFSHHLERGKFFEKPVAELYEKQSGRTTRPAGTGYIKEMPYVRANTDRLQALPGHEQKGIGVLEIKCPSAWSFKKIKKEGLPEAYLLQLQWQMLCYGVSWGSFAVYWPDGHELLRFDVERDEELTEMLLAKAREEWLAIDATKKESGAFYTEEGKFDYEGARRGGFLDSPTFPDKRPPESPACANCSAFDICHPGVEKSGAFLVAPEMEGIAATYSDLTRQIKELEKLKSDAKDLIRLALDEKKASAASAGRFHISVREQTRESISSKVKEILDEKELVSYVKQTSFEVLTVKEGKK